MRKRSFIIVLLLVFSFLSFSNNTTKIFSSSPSLKLIPHDPIVINSDSDFLDYDFEGTGSSATPYMITGYEIEATGLLARGIEISFTTLHFIIENCTITSEDIGIYLYEIAEGTSEILDNTCIGTSGLGAGISVQYTEGCKIQNNTCTNFGTGIYLRSTLNCDMKFNNASYNTQNGIAIRASNFMFISFNHFEDNSQHGLAIISASSFSFIHHNTFIDNSKESIYTITDDRTGTTESQGYDEGNQNMWHDASTGHGNWWSDWDGVGVYEIDGSANSIDLYPQQIDQNGETTSETSLSMISSITLLLFSTLVIIIRKFNKQ